MLHTDQICDSALPRACSVPAGGNQLLLGAAAKTTREFFHAATPLHGLISMGISSYLELPPQEMRIGHDDRGRPNNPVTLPLNRWWGLVGFAFIAYDHFVSFSTITRGAPIVGAASFNFVCSVVKSPGVPGLFGG